DYPDAHLLLGLLFARAGETALARRELESLSRANQDSRVARRILASLDSKVTQNRHPHGSGRVRLMHQRSRLNATGGKDPAVTNAKIVGPDRIFRGKR
ncbi:MAG: hypothetical protein ACREAC_27300, partial [Blastocatellia bacterium]